MWVQKDWSEIREDSRREGENERDTGMEGRKNEDVYRLERGRKKDEKVTSID